MKIKKLDYEYTLIYNVTKYIYFLEVWYYANILKSVRRNENSDA